MSHNLKEETFVYRKGKYMYIYAGNKCRENREIIYSQQKLQSLNKCTYVTLIALAQTFVL